MLPINRGTVSVRVNPIHGNGIDTYCKLTQYEYSDATRNKYTFSFGTGPRRFCLVVAINGEDYSSAYIDRVDRIEKCSKGTGMTDIADAMVKFVSLGLYTIKRMCPWVKRFTLKDDSKLVCNGSNGPSIRLSYDYLIKYNMTWYQKKFGAQLDSPMKELFVKSLEGLDKPCVVFESILEDFPELEPYRDIYESSNSPREFLTRVRSQFPDPASFCRGVTSWFDRYMGTLRIRLFMDSWFISVEDMREPVGFRVDRPVDEWVLNGGGGGRTRRKKTVRGRKRQTTRSQPLQGITGGFDSGHGVVFATDKDY